MKEDLNGGWGWGANCAQAPPSPPSSYLLMGDEVRCKLSSKTGSDPGPYIYSEAPPPETILGIHQVSDFSTLGSRQRLGEVGQGLYWGFARGTLAKPLTLTRPKHTVLRVLRSLDNALHA